MTLEKAISLYLDWIGGANKTIGTINTYAKNLHHFSNYLKNMVLEQLKLEHVRQFQVKLKGRGLKDATIANYTIPIRNMLTLHYHLGNTTLNPKLIPVPKYINTSWKPASEEHLRKMLRVIESGKYSCSRFLALRNELILRFLFSSGVRVSEMCDLTLDAINLKEREAIIITKKNRTRRVIMWDITTNEVLRSYLRLRQKIARSEFVFISCKRGGNTKLTTRSVERLFETLRKKAGIQERIVPHSCRHGFGGYGVKKNMNLRHLQVLLGHKNLNSSQIYMPFNDMSIREDYRKIFSNRLS